MSKRYTSEQRAEALACLDSNHGSIAATSLQTGIPERTLTSWRSQRIFQSAQQQQQQEFFPPQQQQPVDIPNTGLDDPASLETLLRLRAQIMQCIFDITASLHHDDDHLNTRSLTLSRLMDRVFKLDLQILKIMPHQPQTIRFQHLYPDGTIHDRPPWVSPDVPPEDVNPYLRHRRRIEEDARLREEMLREEARQRDERHFTDDQIRSWGVTPEEYYGQLDPDDPDY